MAILIVTIDIPQEVREALKSEAAPLVQIEDVREVVLLSADPPSFIKILAEAMDWSLPLKAAVGIFLSQLAKNAAEDLWKNKVNVAKALASTAASPIRKLVGAFMKVSGFSAKPLTLAIGIPLPDDRFGAAVTLPVNSTEDLAVTLAIFVYHAQEIEHSLQKQFSAGKKSLDPSRFGPNRTVPSFWPGWTWTQCGSSRYDCPSLS